ncbi:MAG: hypothetical protein KBA53_00145 [Thermoclostridium sp.]|nr:hypothetical protein [Thermoclostridium sp.]
MKKFKTGDWILLILSAASLVGCIVEYQRRYRFIYFCLPLIFFIFFFVQRRFNKEKGMLVKMAALFLVTMFVIYCSLVFYITSTPIGMVRDLASERFVSENEIFEQLSIPSMNGNASGWLYKHSDEKAPLVIFFNGAGECASETVWRFWEEGILSEYFPGSHFMCTDYPSYGFSDGFVCEASMKELALITYDTAIQWDFVDKSNITVIGYSIGTGPASYLASQRELASLALLAPYDKYWNNRCNASEARAEREGKPNKFKLAFERVFYGALCGFNLDLIDYADSIEEPVLIIYSLEDTTILPEGTMRFADKIQNVKVAPLTEVKHEELLCNTSYEMIRAFLNE